MTRSSATRLIVTGPARSAARRTANCVVVYAGALDGRVIEACYARAAFRSVVQAQGVEWVIRGIYIDMA
jgi:hypothetical protein